MKSPMKALIVEDEAMARTHLARILSEHFPDVEVVGMTASVQETLRWLEDPSHSVSLIFMDVELSDGDCFEIFARARITADVVMTTAYDTYAVKAFEAGSVDYLLKPVGLKELERAVERCRLRQRPPVDLQALMEAAGRGRTKSGRERIVVYLGDQVIPVNTADIAYVYSEDKYNHLVTAAGADYIVDASMETLTEELDPARFFRISRGCIIALPAICSISRHLSGRLVLTATPPASFPLTVSRARVGEFLAWLER